MKPGALNCCWRSSEPRLPRLLVGTERRSAGRRSRLHGLRWRPEPRRGSLLRRSNKRRRFHSQLYSRIELISGYKRSSTGGR